MLHASCMTQKFDAPTKNDCLGNVITLLNVSTTATSPCCQYNSGELVARCRKAIKSYLSSCELLRLLCVYAEACNAVLYLCW